MKTEKLKELAVWHRRAAEVIKDHPAKPKHEETADALQAWIVDREKAEPVGYLNPNGGYLSAKYLAEYASGLEKETHIIEVFAAPPDLEAIRHNLQVTTDTMRQFEELAARRLVEIESIRARVAELEEFRRNAVEVSNCYANEALRYQKTISAKAEQINVAREAMQHYMDHGVTESSYYIIREALAKLGDQP